MAYLFLGIYYNVSIWYKLADKTLYGALIATIGAAVTLIFSLLLLPVYGVDASAWTALLCYVTMVVLAWWLGRKYYPIHYPMRRIALHLAVITFFLLLGSTVNYYFDNSLWRGMLVLSGYMALLIFIERTALKRILKGKL
jgi:O-antigen/teichoic acid export membrane protein